ncbi:MAG TPA: hypothetical protein VGM75_34265 [Pseudonocardiaceae bacterium]|jgi:hypothetical protein
MGYTHYYRYAPNHPSFRAGWPQMVEDAQRIIDRVRGAGVVISGLGDAPPVSIDRIAFDGDGEAELTGESFVITPTLADLNSWEYDEHGVARVFCKTERFPYDLAVTAVLLRCRTIAPDVFALRSDGDWTDDWAQEATYPATGLNTRDLVAELFGDRPLESPFTD